eukprot:GHUV01007345.1.p1 GENE.GHUV01007345.1~~GHUV01007345.1.p1  ORF type:complete len:1094 (+),score=299.39 GHUV01007345.1:294-3575(+)
MGPAGPVYRSNAARSAAAMVVVFLAAKMVSGQDMTPVTNHQEFLAALNSPSVQQIAITKPFTLNSSLGPATVTRQLLITSPFRAILDWCDEACNTGAAPANPFLVAGPGAMITFNRLFFRNFIPHSQAALNNTALDFSKTPIPYVQSTGGQVTYNLVVMHWTPDMFWVFSTPNTYWPQAAVSDIWSVGVKRHLQFETPQVYNVKNFALDGTATIADCYMPVDVHGCLTDQPFDTTLIYCPYSFKDSLKNPWVDNVVVFHDIGLDRLVNSYRNPAVVNRTVQYTSCPGTMHTMDLDNITNSVVVTAGGSLTFNKMVLQGSKSQDKKDWPSHIPLLLSTFKPVGSGTVILRDSAVRVLNMDALIDALDDLPRGLTAAVESPNLQPTYEGPAPTVGASNFTIKRWQLQQQRWLVQRVGGTSLLDKIGSNGMASWQFFNVTVGSYRPTDCFNAAFLQGTIGLPGSYSVVTTGQQLIDQLANTTARHIRVDSDLTVPALAGGQVAVNRIVEVRACHPGGAYTIDWNDQHDAVIVSGTAIFEGDLVMKGTDWDSHGHGAAAHVVDTLHPAGSGTVEYEDLTVVATMDPALWSNDMGHSRIAGMMGIPNLDDNPLNMSLMGPTDLLIRGFWVNRSSASGGQDGLESFLDVMLLWEQGSNSQSLTDGQIAAVIVAVVMAVLAGAVVAVLFARRRKHRRSACKTDDPKGGSLLPRVFAEAACRYSNDKDSDGSGSPGIAAAHTASGTADNLLSEVAGSSTVNSGRQKSGPSQDIVQACKNLVLRKTAREADELVLQSVLGEGSYGKVFKATWKGTVVAVKIMVLPSYMTGKEKREKMAVMETAISSSLSHPNVVQTYTYAVEPVRSNTAIGDRSHASGPGADISMHDSTFSWGPDKSLPRSSSEQGSDKDSNAGAFSWEVRLVQEFCDLGSLRDSLRKGKFKSADGSLQMTSIVDTALDVARAMVHLHTHNILHSDLKARNVLLRSDAHNPRGFVAKVADFGLSLTIDPHSTHISNAFQGTMTHMAPETLMHGQVSRASDVFAYGILLWELYTGEQAYKGVPRALLGHKITKQGLRPEFPADTPFDYQFLACRCWETDPAIR